MSVADGAGAAGGWFGCLDEALRVAGAALDYVHRVGIAAVDGSACGPVLLALGEMQAKLSAARAEALRKFDAADGHDADVASAAARSRRARRRL